ARALWQKCLGCPRVICMALAYRRVEKERAGLPEEELWTVRAEAAEALPGDIHYIYDKWFSKVVVGKSPKPELAEEMLKLASLMPYRFKPGWLAKAIRIVKSEVDEGDIGRVLKDLEFGDFFIRDAEGRLDFAPGYQVLKAWIREELLTGDDRAKKHAILANAFWALREAALAREGKVGDTILKAIVTHAVGHLREAERAGLEADEEVLRRGLRAGRSLSAFYYRSGDAGPCVEVALMAREIAEALGEHLAELKLIERAARYADQVGLPTEGPGGLRELVGRAEELTRLVRPGKADEALYHYCYAARFLAHRLGGPEGLRLLERLEDEFTERIRIDWLRLDARSALLDVRAKLLLRMGRLKDAEDALKEHKGLVEELRAGGHLKEDGYHDRMAAIERDLGELCARRGREEDLREAIEHFRAFGDHARAAGREDGVALARMNEAICLLALGKDVPRALGLLEEASEVLERHGHVRAVCRVHRLSCLGHIMSGPGHDDEALGEATKALELALGRLRGMPFELADSYLVMALACLVARRAPEQVLKAVSELAPPSPPGVPGWLHVAVTLSEEAEKIFESMRDANRHIARLVKMVGLLEMGLMGLASFDGLLGAVREAEEAHSRLGHRRARLLGECLGYLEERGRADEEFLRRYLARVLV
ncbi:hypothetical protein DRO33_05385, partial [Candidatus Bathyarchaeota archaeon]